ncbi:4-hydroxybenzoate octaprenyltransferase [Aestuariibacter halophilus]|uniref:4-hydroxybenzoate octaprenyltransferase n=1 Tax=Fluctibacter halophilus TaxID=226011 RepID=A0ABS8GA99_9ALTE|nr:4-hydroxybenzoate octaprenyltransferase [Aestuariibacter halophilus]MCC2617527.1 4-hydroxybenzoate octaprenyltransferase [Aestuariibacter halophilus]
MLNKTSLHGYWRLMRADKPIGTYLLLWPTWWALLLAAQGWPGWHLALVFSAGVFVMRSAGCVINDYADRHVDGAVKRTQGRPLVDGSVTEKEAIFLFIFLILIAFILVLTLNFNTILLSVGGLLLAWCYPFMKRYTHWPQVVLGAAFSWSIPMAAMATLDHLPVWVWWVYLANLLWTVGYDTEYAMVDRDDDLRIGVKSTAILFGRYDKVIIALLQLLTLLILAGTFWHLSLSWPVYVGLAGMAATFCYQQWLIRQRDRQACFAAFLNNHYGGLAVVLGLAGHYLL